jgi:EAL domain-containing protein (putative c-di-GMP-specific phosphodiesterase class I)
MGKALGLTVVAEGVETREQDQFLRDRSCDALQGYLFSETGSSIRNSPSFVDPTCSDGLSSGNRGHGMGRKKSAAAAAFRSSTVDAFGFAGLNRETAELP